jgi:hypothetical protein
MATVKELLTNLGDSTRKFLGTSDTLSLEEMAVGIGKASDESDFQTELIEEFSNILDRSAAPDSYANGKEDGYADALDKRTDLVVTENGEYTPTGESTGFKSVSVNVKTESKLVQMVNGTATELTAEDLAGVTKIPQYLFQTNKNIRSVSLSDTVTSIGMYAFADSAIRTIDLASVTYIGENAFYRCTGSIYQLNNLVLPSTITTIGSRAFQQCIYMKTVVVQGNIPLSSTNLFAYNTALTTVTVISTTPPTLSSSAFDGCTALKEIIVPRGCGDAYKSATNWSAHASKIVEGDV